MGHRSDNLVAILGSGSSVVVYPLEQKENYLKFNDSTEPITVR